MSRQTVGGGVEEANVGVNHHQQLCGAANCA